MTTEPGNLFEVIPAHLADEQFDTLLETAVCCLERIISMGHATPVGEWYDQAWAEWVILLQGEATLRFMEPDWERTLKPGDYLTIPAHCRHRVEATSQNPPAVWLALHIKPTETHD